MVTAWSDGLAQLSKDGKLIMGLLSGYIWTSQRNSNWVKPEILWIMSCPHPLFPWHAEPRLKISWLRTSSVEPQFATILRSEHFSMYFSPAHKQILNQDWEGRRKSENCSFLLIYWLLTLSTFQQLLYGICSGTTGIQVCGPAMIPWVLIIRSLSCWNWCVPNLSGKVYEFPWMGLWQPNTMGKLLPYG